MPLSRRTPVESATSADEPGCLAPYAFHGADLSVRGSHAVGDCPFCGREGKFSVEVATGLWRCFACGTGTAAGGGNGLVFARLVYDQAAGANVGAASGVPGAFLAGVAVDRRLLSPAAAAAWGVARAADGAWLVPGYGTDGRLDQVYRRVRVRDKGEWVWRLLPTPGIWPPGRVHALHLPAGDFDPERPNLVVCEGPWDGMALWEVWDRSTGNTNIVAVPGCNVWRDDWTALCRGKCVTLMFDSDHPREFMPGKVSRAGYDGMARVARRLSGVAASVRWLKWGEEGYDPTRPSGWDVRDHLSQRLAQPDDLASRRFNLEDLLARVEDAPRDWFCSTSPVVDGQPHHAGSVESMPCQTFAACEAAWVDAMQWRQELGDALAVLLAVCASTQQGGNQLFLQLVGSAGSGKTTMCDGLLVSGHCHHLEHLTGFHSGYKLAEDSGKDCSLVARINGKTLVTPEADVMMSSPRFQEIMSQQRRIFDGKSGATYKNSDRDTLHVGLRTPWIMAGTNAMMDHDQSHLGDRFIRFMISDPSDDEKRMILRKALRSERVAMLESANGTAGSVVDPKTRRAHALTGGYVDWLRANVEEELARVDVPVAAEDYCIDLAELSADLRARPNEDRRKVEVHDSKELPTRLARQNIRLASCLAVVLNRRLVDADVLRIVRKVALDTAAGHSLNIVRWLCSPNPRAEHLLYQESGGLMLGILGTWTGMTPERLERYLAFLRKIDVLHLQESGQSRGAWRLTERAYSLYLRVMSRQSCPE